MKTINDNDLKKGWIRTSSGNQFDFWSTEKNVYDIEEIATALANTCRFGGHVKQFYSVAQHSVLAALELVGYGVETQLAGLMHDAAEAYVGDIVRPLKHQPQVASVFDTIEENHLEAICNVHDVLFPLPREVKDVDNRLLATEMRDLCTHEDCPWYAPYEYEIYPWSHEQAKESFLSAYHHLKQGTAILGVGDDNEEA